MSIRVRLEDVRRAAEARDPELPRLVEVLAGQPDEAPATPLREGAPTWAKFVAEIHGHAFRKKSLDEQRRYRVEQARALESPGAEAPLPDRLRLHETIDELWRDGGPFARSCLLKVIAEVRLTYGPWRALKRIFKEAESRGDTEVFGALAARIDMEYARGRPEISRRTLAYLRRRAWRFLRRTALTLPACYPDFAVDVLVHYDDQLYSGQWAGLWIANHVFFHESRKYNRTRFRLGHGVPSDLLKDRAFADLWRRSPRPLFDLLERARNDVVRKFAADSLKADFRTSLREVEPAWVARLVGLGSESVDEFVVWILNNVPRFEQAAFRALGLHEAVLLLFQSPSDDARAYAAEYARTHARDLPVAELIRLANNDHAAVRRLAADLLRSRDPRKDVGLEAWGRLLESEHGHELAADVLRKHYGARELTPEWFQSLLLSDSRQAFQFATELLPRIHPFEKLGPDYFRGLIDAIDAPGVGDSAARNVWPFAMKQLAKTGPNDLDRDFLRRLLLRPHTRAQTLAWIDEGRVKAQALGLDFLKALAFHPGWEADPWLGAFRRDGPEWARGPGFDDSLSDHVLAWLRDVRRFTPAELGFEWLMRLAARSEPKYHDFAVETMIKGFAPADFAATEAGEATLSEAPASVDFGGASFLFTGKMATMPRKEAEDKVRQSNGSVASGVTAKLHYLVIGDEGSALYGHGKKGDKQTKAEKVNEGGGNIKIISETAFLKMLVAGAPQAVSQDAALAGAERLWQLATAPGQADAALARFAIQYIRRRHPEIALAVTDRPVDPGAEIPAEFLTFERVRPLFDETRKPLRDLALELARWEFARWNPSADALVALAGSPHDDVKTFVAGALLADDVPETRRFRIDPSALAPEGVYRFCDSADEATRSLGLRLIQRVAKFQAPEELFRLTESPDRNVRAFVIRKLWSLYRDRGITDDWKPNEPPKTTVGAAARKAAAASAEGRGQGAPARPEGPPAPARGLWDLLRRILFEIPPPRPDKKEKEQKSAERLKPIPARRAKLELIEMIRDLALEDAAFARGAAPLLEEFMASRGPSERAACLVAVTRIRRAHRGPLRAVGGAAS